MTNMIRDGSVLGSRRSATEKAHDSSAVESIESNSASTESTQEYVTPMVFISSSGEATDMEIYSDSEENTSDLSNDDEDDVMNDINAETQPIDNSFNLPAESPFSHKVGALMIEQLQPVKVPLKSISENEFLEHLASKGFSINAEHFLGEGSFAKVFGASFRQYSSNENEVTIIEVKLAAKVIELEKMCHEFRTLHFPRELHCLKGLKHEYIAQIFHIELNPSSSLAVIFQELAVCDLEDYTTDRYVGEAQMLVWFHQIASALDYCHNTEGVAHRDIKLANILLFAQGCVKLTDFGFAMPAIHVETGEVIYSGNRYSIGTRMYNAPEIVNHEPYNPFETDVWSLGIVLYTTVQNRFPFDHELERKSLYRAMMNRNWSFRSKYPISYELKCLITRMLEPVAGQRATMTSVMAHPWLTNQLFLQLPPATDQQVEVTDDDDEDVVFEECCSTDENNNEPNAGAL